MIKANNQSGLTLIELLISMAIAGMLLAAMVLAFTAQSKTYNTQQEVSTLQEDMKAALQLMSRDIRMAGYNPTGSPGFSIVAATSTTFNAAQDFNGDGVPGGPEENILYSFVTPAPGSTATIMRSTNGGALQPVIDNITHLGFEYLMVTDGASPTSPSVRTWKYIPAPIAGDLPNIRAVKVCIQGRTPRQTSTTTDTGAFWAAFNSGAVDWSPTSSANRGKYQWRTMCVEVKCRNL
jgi:type IV pilus assembly protein PilW